MTPLFSTAYFPPVAYMAALIQFPEVRIEVKETFPKQTYRNRMEIMTAEGVRTLSVPTLRNNHSRTEEVRIDYKERWNIIHLRTLDAAYAASPYYQYYRDDIVALLSSHHDRLVDLNTAILEWLLKKTKTSCIICATDDYIPATKDNECDYRNAFSPKHLYPTYGFKPYYQVFNDRQSFAPNLSILDLLMNLGGETRNYLTALPL